MLFGLLDDDAGRKEGMLRILSREYPAHEVRFFDNAPDMVDWLRTDPEGLILLSLDHDLGPNRERDGEIFDPGTGRQVAEVLLDRTWRVPVVVHSSNGPAADGMQVTLETEGWKVSRSYPFADLDWLEKDWIDVIRESLGP
ncbi:MAG: hypothetical protein O7H41_10885 [Planctomycetota bacterium]|nr:hypothetical protein [Planctomycetota bacterium]